jgi:hypothetical protein
MIKYQFSLSIDLIATLVLGVYMFVEEGCENFGKYIYIYISQKQIVS